MKLSSLYRTCRLASVAFAGLVPLLIGCGSGGVAPVSTPPVTPPVTPPAGSTPGATFNGSVMAGSQPVAGSSVQLYAVGSTGNGSTATALLTSALITDANGAFNIPAGYPCPSSSAQLYLIARGGKLPTASANSSIVFLSTIGACNQVSATSRFVVNEVTTVANVWALSQFLTASGNIGSSATNSVGLSNAIAIAASLANPANGTSPGLTFPANGSSPGPRINSLANLVNSCIATDAASAACSGFFFTSGATDTLSATFKVIRNPAANVAALYAQSKLSSAFSPVLQQAPSDWTLFLNFTGGGMSSPSGIGVDSAGNVWVANYFNVASKFTPIGAPVFPSGITGLGLNSSYGLAVDAKDNAWIPNENSPYSVNSALGSVTVLNSAGQSLSGATGFTDGGLNYPLAVAIDPNTSAWIIDYGNSHLTQLSSSGAPLSGTAGYISPYFAFPVALAVDASHNVWIANFADVTVTRVSQDGKTFTNFACCNAPDGLAIDQAGNVWIANYYGDSVSEISSSGTVISNGGYTAGGTVYHPQGIAIDGAGNVWVANFRAGYLTELAGAASTSPATGQPISPPAGWAPDAKLFGAFAVAIDASGNVWITNFNNDSITEFVGAAAPIKTPQIGPPQTP